MPRRKTNQPRPTAQQAAEAIQSAISTQDSTTETISDARTPFNLPVILRHVPNCTRIVNQASYCTVYHIVDQSWQKPDIEGPLFLLELAYDSACPTIRYAAFILNRKSLINILLPLPRKAENVDVGSNELISILIDESHRGNEEHDCYGLRIYSEEGMSTETDRKRIGKEILALVTRMQDEDDDAAGQPQSETPPQPLTVSMGGRRVSLSELFGRPVEAPMQPLHMNGYHMNGGPNQNGYGYAPHGY